MDWELVFVMSAANIKKTDTGKTYEKVIVHCFLFPYVLWRIFVRHRLIRFCLENRGSVSSANGLKKTYVESLRFTMFLAIFVEQVHLN
jgi:hypothetical protein